MLLIYFYSHLKLAYVNGGRQTHVNTNDLFSLLVAYLDSLPNIKLSFLYKIFSMFGRKIYSCEAINSHYRIKYWKIIKKSNSKTVGLSEGFHVKLFLKAKVDLPPLPFFTETFQHKYTFNSKQKKNYLRNTRCKPE